VIGDSDGGRLRERDAQMIPVKLNDVADAFDGLMDETHAYINRKTGETYGLTNEEIHLVDDVENRGEQALKNIPQWQRDELPKVRAVLESEDWLELPSKFDFHEYKVMEAFCLGVEDEDLRERLLDAIRGSGAFRRFKNTVDRGGIADEWYDYRQRRIEEFIAEWLEANGIEYLK
jgi:hypothetical protein